jgi:hypothetical protein
MPSSEESVSEPIIGSADESHPTGHACEQHAELTENEDRIIYATIVHDTLNNRCVYEF